MTTPLVPFTAVLANEGWVVFQDKVFDMTTFAPSHPGGGELITRHTHADGTMDLKAAHPGGVKFIKHTFSPAEYAASFKGDLELATKPRLVTHAELQAHCTPADCWLVLDGRVFDFSAFALEHPGGPALVTAGAGQDASAAYRAAHPAGLRTIVLTLGVAGLAKAFVGLYDSSSAPVVAAPRPLPVHLRLAAWLLSAQSVRGLAGGFAAALAGWLATRSSVDALFALAMFAGVVALLTYCWAHFRRRAARTPASWQYGTVTPALAQMLRTATAADRVFVAAEAGAATAAEVTSHARDMSFHVSHPPDAVVYPLSTAEVVAVVKICAEHKIPLVPRGAGSGLEGAAIPYFGGVSLDLIRMKDKTLLRTDLQARVGPGLQKSELNEWLAEFGLVFGPDPASNPCLGGMASTSGSGLSTIKYGTTRENIVSLTVVTPAGDVVRTRSRVRKSSSGYDLTQLYIGSEGTLGVIVELVVKVYPLPVVRTGALVTFADVATAASAVVSLVASGASASLGRCELLNADGVRATNKRYNTALAVAPTLFLEFHSDTSASAAAAWARVDAACRDLGAISLSHTSDAAAVDTLWAARRGCYLAAMTYRQPPPPEGDRVYLSDTCVPVSRLAQMISETEADFVQHGFPCIICAHIADGNFHCCIPVYQAAEKARVLEVEHRMISRAIAMEGTVSGEHGVGVGKINHSLEEHGAAHIELQRRVKRALDPNNIMNPGKIFILPCREGEEAVTPAMYTASEGGDVAHTGTYSQK